MHLIQIDYEFVVRELKKISSITESEIGRPPTSMVGIIGELLVLKKLYELQLSPQYTSRPGKPDIILNDKIVEVKTSHIWFSKKLKCKVAENANIIPTKFDYLIFVVIPEDWGKERFFIFKNTDIENVKSKRIFGEKKDYKQIIFYSEPKNFEQERNNRLLEKYEGKWDILNE